MLWLVLAYGRLRNMGGRALMQKQSEFQREILREYDKLAEELEIVKEESAHYFQMMNELRVVVDRQNVQIRELQTENDRLKRLRGGM